VRLSFEALINQYPDAQNITLGWLGDDAVYRFTYFNQNTRASTKAIVNAHTAQLIDPISETKVVELLPHLLTSSNISVHSTRLIETYNDNVPSEISASVLPVWQVQLDTWDSTRIYVAQHTGEIVYVRHHAWRLFDLFWRLHIMDYIDGDEPENWLLAVVSVISFLAIIAGLITLFYRLFNNYSSKQTVDAAYTSGKPKTMGAWLKQSHQWLALIVFVQLIIWVGSGFLLARIDHGIAAGQTTKAERSETAHTPTDVVDNLVSIELILANNRNVQSVTLTQLHEHWVYRLQHRKSRHAYQPNDFTLIDALSGDLIEISDEIARKLAVESYKSQVINDPPLVTCVTKFYADVPDLPKEQNSIWQISINDALNTNIIVNAQTGSIVAHVNDKTYWRNLFFTLHFMDYANEGSFNNIFSKVFSLLTLLLSLTGLYWLYELLRNKQFVLPLALTLAKKSKKAEVTIYEAAPDKGNATAYKQTIRVNPSLTILDGLLVNGIDVSSDCGGGGICAKCICQLDPKVKPSTADKERLNEEQLAKHYRLACQHRMREVSAIAIYK
jgi:ferredoxin